MEKRNEHVADEHLRVNSQTGANAVELTSCEQLRNASD